MRKFYLVSASLVFLLILIISFAQVGATCSWYLIKSTSAPFLVLLQISGLGAVLGGLLVFWWKAPREGLQSEDGTDDEDSSE